MLKSKWLILMAIGMAVASGGDASESKQPKRSGRQSRWPVGNRNHLRPSTTWSSERLSDFSSSYPAQLAFDIDSSHIPESFQQHYRPKFPEYDDHYPQPPSHAVSDDYGYCPLVEGAESQCRPTVDCAVWFDAVTSSCQLPYGAIGACCPSLPYNNRGKALRKESKKVELQVSPYHPIDTQSINAAAEAGQFTLRMMEETEKRIRNEGFTVRRNSATYTHLLFFQSTSATQKFSRDALLGVETTSEIGKRFRLSPEEAGIGMSKFSLRDTIISDSCPAHPTCDRETAESPFRTIDGSCNNLERTAWGKSKTQFQRALLPHYADGVWLPRAAEDGSSLPSARLVSISVIPDIDSPDEKHSLWVMQYGQFVDHDLTSTPVFRMANAGEGIMCCSEDGSMMKDPTLIHPECLPIRIPDDDPFFAKHGQRCMSFIRSMPAPRSDCNFGFGEQMNQITHFLDNSNVYGSDDEEAASLRTFNRGLMAITPQSGHDDLGLLPPDENPDMECQINRNITGVDPNPEHRCFKAGDSRANEAPQLAVTHTLFMREHNRLVRELAYLNPHWNDERLYQEGRRILIGQMQHITYNEWLPIIIGREKMASLGLLPLEYGFSDDYDPKLNPTIYNSFASAAFRFGHTLVQGKVDLLNQRRKTDDNIRLRNHFFKAQVVYKPGNLDKFLIGLATQPIQEYDNYVTVELTNHLFQEAGKPFGMDLISLNLQRGRDHGIAGYNSYRALCGLPPARHFDDLLDVIPGPIVERFKLLYRSVDDIDLFIAGISERSVHDALVGPTFQCIISDQFLRLKRGDRFFYDLEHQPHSFTQVQLDEIRKTSFARLMCDNSHVASTQPLAFKLPSEINPIVDCHSPTIPTIDLLPWKEEGSANYRHSSKHDSRPYKTTFFHKK